MDLFVALTPVECRHLLTVDVVNVQEEFHQWGVIFLVGRVAEGFLKENFDVVVQRELP